MKKTKGFRMFIALVLAAAMVLPCFAVLAEEAKVTITVTENEEDESKNDVLIEVDGDINHAFISNSEDDPVEIMIDNADYPGDHEGNQLPASQDVSSIKAEIDGDVTNEDGTTGITVENDEVPELDVTAGDVRVHESDDSASGIALQATVDYGDVTVQTESLEASATGTESSHAEGLNVTTANNGSFEANTGDITSTAALTDENGQGSIESMGVVIYSSDESQIRVDAGKIEVSAEWESDPDSVCAYGVDIYADDNSTVRVDTGAMVLTTDQTEGSDISVDGIHVFSDINADVTVVSENITAETDGNQEISGVEINTYQNGSAVVASKGDITAKGANSTGVELDADTESELETPVEIFADGTISGGKAAISASESGMEKANVTAWKIEGGEDGTVVAANRNNENITDKVQSSIHYIVKLADGFSNSDVTTENGDTVTVDYDKTADAVVIHGNVADGEEYTYHTANEDEEVTVNVTLQDGEVFDGIYYNAEGKTDTEKNLLTVGNNGLSAIEGVANSFKLLMKRGGGMMLGLKTHTHDYSVFVRRTKEPTCTGTGSDLYQCAFCDATQEKTVDAKGHTEVTDAAVAATCTETGLTEGKHCSVCNEVLAAQEVVAAKGHTPGTAVTENEQEATAQSEGSYEAVIYCTVCGKELSREKRTIPALEKDSTQEAIIREESKQEANMRNADIADATSMKQKDIDIDLTSVAMPEDVSRDDDDVKLDKLANCPDALTETAKQELAALKRSGYKIDCGFAAWSESGKTAACTLKLSEKFVPDGAQIFVNGAAVQAELKDGYYCFEVTLPAVVLVAHK